MQRLHELEAGQVGIVTDVSGDTRFHSRVTSVGLTIGCKVEILRNEKKYPLLVYSRNSLIALN